MAPAGGSGGGEAVVSGGGDFRYTRAWFAERGWTPFAFQLEAWRAYAAGMGGLIHSPTGTGKTLAAWMGFAEEMRVRQEASPEQEPGLRALWLTPLRALASDTARALQEACDGVGLDWRVELRTGDTAFSVKKRQREKPPRVLVTTPESLCVMLSYPGSQELLSGLRLVVADEWHELMGSKRGVQAELALARLRGWSPELRTWGVSATLGNIEEAMLTLMGSGGRGGLIRGASSKHYEIKTLLPERLESFPWAGHLGLRQLEGVIKAIEEAKTTLLFCNTRGQAEIWFQSLLKARPEWLRLGAIGMEDGADGEPGPGVVPLAIHHGSLDRALRGRVEELLKAGRVRCVVCTSSLDLGVDFPPVDQVIQIGSPKGVGRLLQRAGRSGHQPGRKSRVVCVPTNALELIEFAAARDAMEVGEVESRPGIRMALDVLCQHMVTVASGGGFVEGELLREVRSTRAFAGLTEQQWRWALDFATAGGPSLKAYERFARLRVEEGKHIVASDWLSKSHRMGIGTILSDAAVAVRFANGAMLGSIEEGFLSKMKPGDHFVFSGRRLELISLRDMTATVRPARRKSGVVASWQGARMPLSSELAAFVRRRLEEAEGHVLRGEEMQMVGRLLAIQQRWSALPTPGRVVVEQVVTREGSHAFVYLLEGRLAHEGLAALVAWRLGRLSPRTLSIAANDYGFELMSPTPMSLTEGQWRSLLSHQHLAEDLTLCINSSELARRQFREIARVAGLLVPSPPGMRRQRTSAKHMQASSELYFDVFEEFDEGNLLLDQARREVLSRQLEYARMERALRRVGQCELTVTEPGRLTPMGFPLWADRLRAQVSSESWEDRVQRMLAQLEADAGTEAASAAVDVAAPKRLRASAERLRGKATRWET